MTAAFTVGFIVGKVAGHLNDLYLKKKKILRKAIELPILGQNLDNCGSAQEMQYGFWPWVGKIYMIVWEVTGKRFEICTQSFSQGQNVNKTN